MDKGQVMLTEEESRLFDEMMAYKEDVFRICLGFSRNPSDAEDLSQDVYLKAFQKVGKVHTPYALKEWLFRIVRNTCLDHGKKRRVVRCFEKTAHPENAFETRTPESSAEMGEHLNTLKKAVSRLPKRQREVFVLREYGHLSYQELARTLGIKEGTVMSRLNRARRAIIDSVNEGLHGQKQK
jgi:RNA polymerase sigma-70 factor (ECF subfamily)